MPEHRSSWLEGHQEGARRHNHAGRDSFSKLPEEARMQGHFDSFVRRLPTTSVVRVSRQAIEEATDRAKIQSREVKGKQG